MDLTVREKEKGKEEQGIPSSSKYVLKSDTVDSGRLTPESGTWAGQWRAREEGKRRGKA